MKLKLKRVIFIFTLLLSTASFAQDGFIGEIRMFAGNYAPLNWAFCEGQVLSINDYASLYSVIQDTYGGDGRTTFALPDFRGRIPVGAGAGSGLTSRVQGATYGSETATLTELNLPSHNHTVNATDESGTDSSPEGNLLAHTSTFDNEYTSTTSNVTMGTTMIGNTGSGESFKIIQPSMGMYYIICLSGDYPSRN